MSFAVVSGDSIWSFSTRAAALAAFASAVNRSASARLVAVCERNGQATYRDLTPSLVYGEYVARL